MSKTITKKTVEDAVWREEEFIAKLQKQSEDRVRDLRSRIKDPKYDTYHVESYVMAIENLLRDIKREINHQNNLSSRATTARESLWRLWKAVG